MQLPTFPPAEKQKLVAAISGVYQKWLDNVKAKGLPGREVQDVYMAELAKRGVTVTLPIK